MSGFAAPSILFLNTWDKPERDFVLHVSKQLRASGRFTRIVEPCAGAFVMPSVHVTAGWKPAQLETSDVGLYTSLLGCLFGGLDFGGLDVKIDGQTVPLSGIPLDDCVTLIYEQAKARIAARPTEFYWLELARYLESDRKLVLDSIKNQLTKLDQRLHGLTYTVEDMWSHMRRVAFDDKTIISINPPTYKAGFERFFDTKGRLTWNEPEYAIFDPAVHQPELAKESSEWPALMLVQQQVPYFHACPHVVHARELSREEGVYIWTNKPDVVESLRPRKFARKRYQQYTPVKKRIIPPDHNIADDSTINVVPVKWKNAGYYRNLWIHRIDTKDLGAPFLVLVDDFVAGMGSISDQIITRPYRIEMEPLLLMTVMVGAPHQYRLTRLVTMVGLLRRTARLLMNDWTVDRATGIVTVEYTRHPEAKGLRGLMKLRERIKDKDKPRLIYTSEFWDVDHDDAYNWETILNIWLKKEKAYLTQKERHNG